MKSSKILIVEDDPFIADDLRRILMHSGYAVPTVCEHPNDALSALRSGGFDLILLDIHLNSDMDGIDLAQRINAEFHCPFIFITAFVDESTVRKVSYTHPQGYISKPYNQADVLIGVELALRRSLQNHEENTIKDEVVQFVKTAQGLERIDPSEIVYLEANDYYSFIHLSDRKMLATTTLKQLEHDLALNHLCRIHRSYVVNILKVTKIVGNELEVGGRQLPVSRSYKELFLEKIKVL